jgi:hypothetical protein
MKHAAAVVDWVEAAKDSHRWATLTNPDLADIAVKMKSTKKLSPFHFQTLKIKGLAGAKRCAQHRRHCECKLYFKSYFGDS